jgi:hypothetical protein
VISSAGEGRGRERERKKEREREMRIYSVDYTTWILPRWVSCSCPSTCRAIYPTCLYKSSGSLEGGEMPSEMREKGRERKREALPDIKDCALPLQFYTSMYDVHAGSHPRMLRYKYTFGQAVRSGIIII